MKQNNSLAVDLTEDDISRGVPLSCDHCPIALALRRITGDKWTVDGIRARRAGKDGDSFSLPVPAVTFAGNFDHGLPVKPFSFTLSLKASKR
jgi:hypothetical protein